MALLFSEGFASYADETDMAAVGFAIKGSTSFIEIAPTGGYGSSPAIAFGGNGTTQGAQGIYTPDFVCTSNEIYSAFYYLIPTNVRVPGNTNHIFSFETAEGYVVQLKLATSGFLQIGALRTSAGSSTVLATGTTAIDDSTQHHIEIKYIIGTGTSGVAQVWVDGVLDINVTATNTDPDGYGLDCTDIVRCSVCGGTDSGATDSFVSHWLIWDGSGSAFNSRMGACRIETLTPSGAGANTGFTPSAGSNYQCVDEASVNSDTDYVEHATATTKDTYTYTDMATTIYAVKAVAVKTFAKSTDVGGAKSFRNLAKSGASYGNGSDESLINPYGTYWTGYHTDPATGGSWTEAAVNAAEFGFEVRS